LQYTFWGILLYSPSAISLEIFFIIAHRYTLENTEGAIKNGQCSETGNIVYTRRNKTTAQYVLDTTIHIDKQIT
jgi:hypothetical protein